MNDELLTIQDILGILKRHILMIVLMVIVFEGLALGLAKSLPRKYKSSALLNLQATYFEVPLLGDGIVGSRDSVEMHAQKEALIRLALSDVFIDTEGEKYGLFRSDPGTAARAGDRDGLRKSIEYFPASTTTFQISAVGRTSEIAYGLASDALDQIISLLVSERQKSIMNYRESLRKQLEALGVATSASEGGLAVQPQVLKEQLTGLQQRLTALEAQYNSSHPAVIAMKQKIEALERQLGQTKEIVDSVPVNEPLTIDPTQKGRRTDFGEELLKKINYLDIALEIETNKKDLPYLEVLERPVLSNIYFFPKVNAFAIGGLLAGFLLAAITVAFLELKRLTAITPIVASKQLGFPLLGALPIMLQTPGAPTGKDSS
jgi:hypothetical protein